MKHATDVLPKLILLLENEPEFDEIVSAPVRNGYDLSSKYARLRAYLEERFGGNPLQEIPRAELAAVPRLYRRLLKYGEILHPIPRCESRRISAIPAMTAEVIIHFTM